jgi:hypothetical protein
MPIDKDAKITLAMIEEWREDFPKFCADCLEIVNKDSELVPFVLNGMQLKLWEQVKNDIAAGRPTRIYLLKARQLGSSTFTQALAFWRTVLWRNSNALVVAHDLDAAEGLFAKSKVFFGRLPHALRPERKLSNRRELSFAKDDETGDDVGLQSAIRVATAKDAHLGAALTLNFVHLSEFARWENIQKNTKLSLATLMQTVPKRPNTHAVIETTAWGMNFSQTLWVTDNGWTKMFISWISDTTYTATEPLDEDDLSSAREAQYGDEVAILEIIQEELCLWYEELRNSPKALLHEALCRMRWRREKIDLELLGSKELFQQEYPLTAEEAFLTSGTSVFNTLKLADYRHAIEEEDREVKTQRYDLQADSFYDAPYGDLRIFAEPEPGRRYVIGADVSEGLSDGDNSAAQVLDVDRLEQVAVYQGQCDPAAFADLLANLGHRYNTAFIGVEVNGPGFATNLRLGQHLHYPRVYRRETFESKSRKWTKRFGWHTNRGSKAVAITDLRKAVRDDLVRFRDIETLTEMGWYTLDPEKGSMNAAPGYHDDLVMALAIGLQMVAAGNYGPMVLPKDNVIRKGSFQWFARQLDREADKRNYIGWRT